LNLHSHQPLLPCWKTYYNIKKTDLSCAKYLIFRDFTVVVDVMFWFI